MQLKFLRDTIEEIHFGKFVGCRWTVDDWNPSKTFFND